MRGGVGNGVMHGGMFCCCGGRGAQDERRGDKVGEGVTEARSERRGDRVKREEHRITGRCPGRDQRGHYPPPRHCRGPDHGR